MRIALIASSLRLAGAEKQFVFMARALRQAGIDAQVFYLGPGDYFQNVLTNAGVPLHQIFNPGQRFVMLGRLIKALYQFKPRIVHASQFGDLSFAGPAGRCCNALVLSGVRSDGFYELRTSGHRSWLLLRLSHGLIANSYRAKANLESKGVAARKIQVLPNVIDLSEFDAQAAMPLSVSIPVDRLVVIAVGSLHRCKRFDRFLYGLALARLSEPKILGVIAGKDLGQKSRLEHKAKDLGLLPGHLIFAGECNQIPALLRQSRLLVLCSEYEGFPNVILEAMAARLPVITTPVGDCTRIVKQGLHGYVIEPDETSVMAKCIVELVEGPKLSQQMGDAGRKVVEEEYSFGNLSNRVLSVFHQFAQRHGKCSLMNALRQSLGGEDSVSAHPNSGPVPTGLALNRL